MTTTTTAKSKIIIYQEDTYYAIKQLNKKKAVGADNLTMKPLDYENIFDVRLNGRNAIQVARIFGDYVKRAKWQRQILEVVSSNLT